MSKLIKRYYLIFKRIGKWRWWNIFTGKQFAHVFLITELGARTTAVFDTSKGTVKIWKVNRNAEKMVLDYYRHGFIVGTYLVKEQDKGLQAFISCVGFCKYILGINKWWILTPKQLYKEVYRVHKLYDRTNRYAGHKSS